MDSQISQKVAAFFGSYPLQKYKKNQILIHAGDDPQSIFYLTVGKVKQYGLSYRGDEVILNVFKPGAFFPMSFAINRTPNDYFFQADSDIELRKVPVDDALAFIKDNGDVLYDLLSRVYRGTDGLLGRIAYLMASTAKSRIMYELIVECRRFGIKEDGGYIVNLSESDLGARAGLSRETVNRELKKLREDGLIDMSERHIRVPDLPDLEASLGRDL